MQRRRLGLGLLQKEVARKIGVCENTVCNWENNQTEPSLRLIPRIIKFLGYVPSHKQPETFGDRLINARQMLGTSQEELAQKIDVDPSTIGRLKNGKK